MKKTAADLGEKNIPMDMINMIAPTPVQVLYWREEASTPTDTTVELWMTQANTFIVLFGTFGGMWDPANLTSLNEGNGFEFTTLESGLAAIKRNFTFGSIEEPHEQTTASSNKIKRLIKKSK